MGLGARDLWDVDGNKDDFLLPPSPPLLMFRVSLSP